MANFFVAYERVSDLGDIAAFEAALSSLGEVVIVHDSLVLLKTSTESMDVLTMLMPTAAGTVRYVIVRADATASLMNVRPGVLDAFRRFIEV